MSDHAQHETRPAADGTEDGRHEIRDHAQHEPRPAADGPEDGRLAQGRRRRETLIAATLRVIERDGLAGVTHRRVAREAGVSATSASYHFHTIDELLVATLTAACEECVRNLEHAVAAANDDFVGIARSITDPAAEQRTAQIAAFELWLLVARRPELLSAARVWTTAVTAVARRHSDDPREIEAFVALVDGFHLQVLTREQPPGDAEIEAALRRALGVTAG